MVHELTHPIAKALINRLRDEQTDAALFRQTIAELARILVYEAFASEPLKDRTITTWQGDSTFGFIDEASLMFVPIMRAGMPMLDSLITLFPQSLSGFLAMRRDETTHEAVLYYDRVPDCRGKTVVLLDPMVATGGSLGDAIAAIREKGPERILCLNLIGSPEGLKVVETAYPDIPVYIAQIDDHLNDDKFIIPGLGDAGDRAYNTPE
jgi:uracil phosphoribosyltransferase